MSKVVIKNVSKIHKDKKILNNISLNIEFKSFYLIAGNNGSGKSTLLKIIAGNDSDYDGEIFIDNELLEKIKGKKDALYFNTDLKFPNNMSALKFIEHFYYYFHQKKISKQAIKDKMQDYKITFNKNPNTFSSGEKQKLILILVEFIKPKLLLIDELESNLDIYWKEKFYKTIDNLRVENDMTIVIVSHEINNISPYVTDFVLLDSGKIKEINLKENKNKKENFTKVIIETLKGEYENNFKK
ncbi:ATP-binding cassette domain-containing protein [Mycoplasma sp. 1012]